METFTYTKATGVQQAIQAAEVYLKLRDRASYEFALSSAAVVAVVSNGKLDFAVSPWEA